MEQIPKEMYEALGQITMTKALVDSGLAEYVGIKADISKRKIDGEWHETLHIEMTTKHK